MPRRRTGTLVTILLLLLLAVLLWLVLRRMGPDRAPASIRPVTLSQVPAELPLLLAWEGGGTPFVVTILEPDGAVFWRSQRLSRPLVKVPRPILLRMRLHAVYRWEVNAVDGMGRPFRSAPFPLTLVPDPSLAPPGGS
jgi:hypothetical protein